MKKYRSVVIATLIAMSFVAFSQGLSPIALANNQCQPDPVIYSHGGAALEKYNIATGTLTTITASTGVTFFDIGMTPNGTLYGAVSGSGLIRSIDKTTGVSTLVGTVTTPANTNFNMLAFDKYGKGWFVGASGTQLLSFDPTSVSGGTITPTVVVSDLQAAGFPTGSSSGDVFFLGGDMYIAWATSGMVKLIKLDMTDTGSAYTATGAAGTVSDLGQINAANVWGMAVADGKIYVANGSKISRLNSLPSTADGTRTLTVTDITTGTVGTIYGMTAEGEASVDSCLSLAPTFTETTTPPSTAGQPLDFDLGLKSFGDATLSVSSGQLPPGISLDNTNKKLTGTPTSGGTYNFGITATENDGDVTTQQYTLTVSAATASSTTTTAAATTTTAAATTTTAAATTTTAAATTSTTILSAAAAPSTTTAITAEPELPATGSSSSRLATLSVLFMALGFLAMRKLQLGERQ